MTKTLALRATAAMVSILSFAGFFAAAPAFAAYSPTYNYGSYQDPYPYNTTYNYGTPSENYNYGYYPQNNDGFVNTSACSSRYDENCIDQEWSGYLNSEDNYNNYSNYNYNSTPGQYSNNDYYDSYPTNWSTGYYPTQNESGYSYGYQYQYGYSY